MVTCSSRAPFFALGLLLLLISGCTISGSADPLPVGAEFPSFARSTAQPPWEIVWVIRPEDYLTCQTAADGLRVFQRGKGSGVPVTIVYLGESHMDWLHGFLARHRIGATVIPIRPGEFHRQFGGTAAPWLYLLNNGRVVDESSAAGNDVRPASRWESIMAETEAIRRQAIWQGEGG